MKGHSAGRILFDGNSFISKNGKIVEYIETLNPFDFNFSISELDLSTLNPKNDSKKKFPFILDQMELDVNILTTKPLIGKI